MAWRSLICGDPSPFEPLDKWQVWLEELRAMPRDDDAVLEAIRMAEQEIARKWGEFEAGLR